MRQFFVASLIFISMLSTASGAKADSDHTCQGNSCNGAGDVTVGQVQSQVFAPKIAVEAQGGKAVADAKAFVGVTNNEAEKMHYSGTVTTRNVSATPVNVGINTAPCRVAWGASAGVPGATLGFSGSGMDEGCDVWRDFENLIHAGYYDEAQIRLCAKEELKPLLPHCKK